MRVLFFVPPSQVYDREVNLNEPLGVCSVAAAVRAAGHDVKVIHWVSPSAQPEAGIVSECLGFRPDVVAVSSMTESHGNGMRMLRRLKRQGPVLSVLGGVHVTTLPEAAGDEDVDFGIRGEGEISLPMLLRHVDSGDGPAEKIPGLIRKNSAGIVSNIPERIRDLDALPIPIREGLPSRFYKNYQAATHVRMGRQRVAAISATRGCPFACLFCPNQALTQGIQISRSVEGVLSETRALVRDRQVNFINFLDENFGYRRSWLRGFSEEKNRRGIRVPYFANVSVTDMDAERIGLLRDSGCVMANVGIETGDDDSLARIRKQQTAEQAVSRLREMRRGGLAVTANFLLGFPWQDHESLRRDRRLIRRLDAMWFGLNFAVPFPGTGLRSLLQEEGIPMEENFDLYTCKHPIAPTRHLGLEDLRTYGKLLNRSFYLRWGYLMWIVRFFVRRPRGLFPYLASFYHVGVARRRVQVLFADLFSVRKKTRC